MGFKVKSLALHYFGHYYPARIWVLLILSILGSKNVTRF